MNPFQVIYLGNWGQGVAGLRALLAHRRVALRGVFTRHVPGPTKPEHRLLNATRDLAASANIPVHQSDRSLVDPAAFHGALLAQPPADVLVVCGFDRLIPARVLAMPRLAAVNVHTSLLPAFRGPKPMENAIAHHAPLGVTLHLLTPETDAGDILLCRPIPAPDGGTTLAEAFDLHNAAAAAALGEFFDDPPSALANRRPQDHARASPAPRLPFEVNDRTTLAELRARMAAHR